MKPENTTQKQSKKAVKKWHKPIPSLAAIATPIDGMALGYQFQAIGYFPSRVKARAAVDARMAENPELSFVVLPCELAGKSSLYDKLAATLPPREEPSKQPENTPEKQV